MRLLIVENEKEPIQMYTDVIESFNKQSDVQIQPDFKDNLADGLEALQRPEYDAAIIDLKLSHDTVELEGLKIVNAIINKLRIPLYIVSGSIGQVDIPENALFKKRLRDGDFKDVLTEIVSIYNTGITKILGQKGDIEQYLNDIFWKHLSNSVKVWAEDSTRTSKQKEKSLLRYTLSHIQEHLEISEESDFENYHPAEIYIIPPVKPNVFTGDIVLEKSNGEMSIVLTPSCDLAQTKAKDILIVKIELDNDGLLFEKINIIKKAKVSDEIIKESEIILHQLIENNFSNKYHFLPKYNGIPSGLINFQKIKSVRIKEFNTNFERIASVNSNFTKDIVARFSYYYSRQGSPDFNVKEVYNSLF